MTPKVNSKELASGAEHRRGPVYIGTAGWSIPRTAALSFSGEGSHLERYAAQLNAAEINTTFYKRHKPSTFERWASSVPGHFRFSVKIPKLVTHEGKLVNADAHLDTFFADIAPLGAKLGAILVQLPPKLAFDAELAGNFFRGLRVRYAGAIVFEPRHPTWFSAEAATMAIEHRISGVGADPAPVPDAGVPRNSTDIAYLRWHGAPRVYYSAYDDSAIQRACDILMQAQHTGAAAWCIFDNTASGAAASDAMRLKALLPVGLTGATL